MARPTKYSEEIAIKICEGIAQCKPLRVLAEENNVSIASVFNWLLVHKSFLDKYVRAREIQAEIMADEIREIADENPEITVTTDKGTVRSMVDSAGVNRNRLRVDTRKWLASKFLPKKYGDRIKVEQSGPNDSALPDPIQRIAELFAKASARSAETPES